VVVPGGGGQLLIMLIKAFVPSGAPIVIGSMTPIERRWDPRSVPAESIAIRSDPPRDTSSKPAACAGFPPCCWCACRGPTASWRCLSHLLAPSKRFYTGKSRAPKTLLDWARQAALQIHRWLPDRYIVLVGDSAFAAIRILAAVP